MIKPFSPVSQKPTVTFWGAAQSVTGSMHLVEVGDNRILLDCGKDRSGFRRDRAAVSFPFEPASLTAVVISHAHIDHCGNLPDLVRQGYCGPVYCSAPTRDLIEIMLSRSAQFQEEELRLDRMLREESPSERGPGPFSWLEQALMQCIAVPYQKPIPLSSSAQLELFDAGHILGSAMSCLTLNGSGNSSFSGELTLTFTGDIGRSGLPYLRETASVPHCDVLVCESTYGGRYHQSLEQMADRLARVVERSANEGGVVLIPAFSLGRTQLVAHYLELWMRNGKLPQLPIFVDSPQAMLIAQVYGRYPEHFVEEDAASASNIHYIADRDESDWLVQRSEPSIIIASGGMCEGGRIVKHLKQRIDDPRASLVLVSYQAPDSLGRQMLLKSPTIQSQGRTWNKWIDVVELPGFSGHADHNDFLNYLAPLAGKARKIRLVHGETDQATALANGLKQNGFTDVALPSRGSVTSLEQN